MKESLRQLCQSYGFSVELHEIPFDSRKRYFVILIPSPTEPLNLSSRKEEINCLQQKLIEMCPSIDYVTIQTGSD